MHKAGYVIAFLFGIVLFLALSYFGLVNADMQGALKPLTALPQQIIQPFADNYGTAVAGIGGTAITGLVSRYFYDKLKKSADSTINTQQSTIQQLQKDHVDQTTGLALKVDELHVKVEEAQEKQRLAEEIAETEKQLSQVRLQRKQEEIDTLLAERKALSDLAAEKIIRKEEYIH